MSLRAKLNRLENAMRKMPIRLRPEEWRRVLDHAAAQMDGATQGPPPPPQVPDDVAEMVRLMTRRR